MVKYATLLALAFAFFYVRSIHSLDTRGKPRKAKDDPPQSHDAPLTDNLGSCIADNNLMLARVDQESNNDVATKTKNMREKGDGEQLKNSKGCQSAFTAQTCREISNAQFRANSKGAKPGEQCSWCVKGRAAKCLRCDEVILSGAEIDMGWYCSPGKSQCTSDGEKPAQRPNHQRFGNINGDKRAGNYEMQMTVKEFCKLLEDKVPAFDADVYAADPSNSKWNSYCLGLLGEACVDYCRRLEGLYVNMMTTVKGSGLPYKLIEKDCFLCLEDDDCVPQCLTIGSCVDKNANPEARTYGNWCGDRRSGGRNVFPKEYKDFGGSWEYACIDKIDCMCRMHDKACAFSDDGCCRKHDVDLLEQLDKLGDDDDGGEELLRKVWWLRKHIQSKEMKRDC